MITIGIMNGNITDGTEAIMTEFKGSQIKDIKSIYIPYSSAIKKELKQLHRIAEKNYADMALITKTKQAKDLLNELTEIQIKVVKDLLKQSDRKPKDVSAIAISGLNTLPKNMLLSNNRISSHIFHPAKLAKAVGIPVIYDFAADDIFAGGTGNLFAPIHQLHLSSLLVKKGAFPVCFINGGKTAHLTLISEQDSIKRHVFCFDSGPFHYYMDELAHAFFKKDYDRDGLFGKKGEVNQLLLQYLYNESAITANEENFYDLAAPKTADISFYKMLDKLKKYPLRPEDILRTVEYFAAYTVFISLRFIPETYDFPHCCVVYGGGWKNPLTFYDFQNLLHGRGVILPQHKYIAPYIWQNLRGIRFFFGNSEDFGFNAEFIKSRTLADMAASLLNNQPFAKPEITGCHYETTCGIVCLPNENTRRRGRGYTYSRAAKGWK